MSVEHEHDKSKDLPLGDDLNRHVLEHDKVSFVSEDDQDEGVTRIEALCKSGLRKN